MARANQFQHLGAVAVNVLARLDAKKQVKEQLRAQGIRLTYVPAREIVAQTRRYLEAHPELYERAMPPPPGSPFALPAFSRASRRANKNNYAALWSTCPPID